CTASGKAILAFLPEERVLEIIDERGLEPRTENTITEREELFEELSQIRDQGYANAIEESVKGMRAVAAPIMLEDSVAGSISLAGPANRFVGERFEDEVPKLIKGVANEIELKLTYSESGI
ncbi:IclR family transcriptional regulator, partial [Haloferax profundi]|uniref:IclR family transcriptional regulator n=1 Tax=Haloferax profundi TaxID=1544718 RepID=UPI000AF45250